MRVSVDAGRVWLRVSASGRLAGACHDALLEHLLQSVLEMVPLCTQPHECNAECASHHVASAISCIMQLEGPCMQLCRPHALRSWRTPCHVSATVAERSCQRRSPAFHAGGGGGGRRCLYCLVTLLSSVQSFQWHALYGLPSRA